MTEKLFTPFTAGDLDLKNRVVMAPLTRNRADDVTGEVSDLHVTYYTQRAGAGLIVSEGTQISPEGKGYIQTPGIHTPGQVAAWRKVTDAVHAQGGKIVVQLWHVGAVSHSSIQPDGQAPVSASALTMSTKTFTHDGFAAPSAARALELSEIPRVVQDYVHAAQCAKEAGFDGVELHAANGYLIEQFLKDGTNKRTDAYGGSVENRARLLFDVIDGLLTVWDAGRVGVRLSPFSPANGISDSDPLATYIPVIERLNGYGLAFLHMVEGETGGARVGDFDTLRKLWQGPYMANNGYDRDSAIARVAADEADMIAFGRPFIANPDLVARLKADAPLNELDGDTLYGGGEKGFTDYPALTPA